MCCGQIQSFLVHFWQGMPPHLLTILGTNVLVNLVGVCDSILYRAVCSVLMPSVLQVRERERVYPLCVAPSCPPCLPDGVGKCCLLSAYCGVVCVES